jgi:hypothetical protein
MQDSQSGNAFVNFALVGDGWKKLGFTDYTIKQTHTGDRITDLSLTPQVNVRILNPPLKPSLRSAVGDAHFSVPNIANFGGKLFYRNDD